MKAVLLASVSLIALHACGKNSESKVTSSRIPFEVQFSTCETKSLQAGTSSLTCDRDSFVFAIKDENNDFAVDAITCCKAKADGHSVFAANDNVGNWQLVGNACDGNRYVTGVKFETSGRPTMVLCDRLAMEDNLFIKVGTPESTPLAKGGSVSCSDRSMFAEGIYYNAERVGAFDIGCRGAE